ncbi:MAG: dTDP-4-dehydrorhamnose 3,5-epimerase [Clostridia bacterium]|nr:dTDP-4-dehydrorhamnose 3,5-epimerase [Clostridia bacterium]
MGNFSFEKTPIDGVFIITPKVFGDNRGYFMETYKQSDFEEAGIHCNFIQDNQSKSRRGVLRGLHFQKQYPQAKLVRVIKGEVYDVAVDLRKSSPTFGKHVGVLLSEDNKKQFFIPRGFAHGFLVLSEEAEFVYKCDNLYHPEDEGGLIYNDSEVGINWPEAGEILLSDKDRNFPTLSELNFAFE